MTACGMNVGQDLKNAIDREASKDIHEKNKTINEVYIVDAFPRSSIDLTLIYREYPPSADGIKMNKKIVSNPTLIFQIFNQTFQGLFVLITS